MILKNPAYKGTAAFGKTRSGELKPHRLRPQRGRPEQPRRPVSRVDTSSHDQIFIDVPGLVSEELFGAVQAQLEENRQRRRDRPRGGRYLLQGLVVCKRCGYGCYGKPVSRASAKGKVPYAYYRCTGSDAYRFGGQRLCWNKPLRTDVLDAAIWEDVRHLLSEPERVRAEYERRLQGPETGPEREVKHLNKMIANLRKMISRLIDAYGDGLLDKSEFEPRILAARARLAKLEDECRQRIDEANQEVELRLVIGQLEEFARRVSQELQEPDWDTRREVLRALVKKVEIDEQEVRIVYRVSPSPFEGGPKQGGLQHCWGRDQPSPGQYYVGTQDAHFQFSEMVLICVAGWFGRSGMSCPSVCPMRGSCLTRSFRHCDYGPFAAASWASPRSRWRNCLASPGRPSRGGGPPTPRTAWKPSPANAPAARLAPVAPSSTAKRRGSGRSLTRRAPRR